MEIFIILAISVIVSYLAALYATRFMERQTAALTEADTPKKKLVYIAHPLKGNIVENKRRVDWLCREIMKRRPDVIPVSPIHALGFLDELVPGERDYALKCGLALQETCHETWMFGHWQTSEGCMAEWKNGQRLGQPVIDGRYVYKMRDVASMLRTSAVYVPAGRRSLEVV